jgi:hypothetical protein
MYVLKLYIGNASILPTPHSTFYFDVGIPQFLEFVQILLRCSFHLKFKVTWAKHERGLNMFFWKLTWNTLWIRQDFGRSNW